ncbi:MAG: Flp pilus assembly complex ATPase component TadA [Bdellovibrionaceae bacterium]|nr:Flp pilus assembly complex ATPase component TadA [Pseudobdellovibrionaceae bacterium]
MALHPGCHIIGVIGGKGGVGKSVFTANLAFAFLKEMKASTLLIDLDSKTAGDQNIITGIKPVKTVAEICQLQSPISQRNVSSITGSHPAGLHFLGAVHSPDQNLSGSPQDFIKSLEQLSHIYQYILVDLGNNLEELQASLLEQASACIVVTTPEVLVINQTRRVLNELYTATFPMDMFQLVINKSTQPGLAPPAIAQALKRPVIGAVPLDDQLTQAALQRSTPFVLLNPSAPISSSIHQVVRKLTGGILQSLKSQSRPKAQLKSKTANVQIPGNEESPTSKSSNPMTRIKIQIHTELIKEMDLKKDLTNTKGDPEKEKQLRLKTQQVISKLVDKLANSIPRDERSVIIKQILDESLGLGPLEELLSEDDVSEIMVNGHDRIFVERSGRLTLDKTTFTSNLQLRNVIERIVTPLGRRIDEKNPYVDARLADGSRVNAVIEPLAIDGPTLTIRKFAKELITPQHYLNWGTMTQPMVDFLKICVEQGLNIVISGGTGSGKTTLLNVMSQFIPQTERIITVEDAAELQLNQEHVVRLETRPANMEGTGEVSIRDLIRNTLRMRPDRIIVGECRDGAALDMLSAMNTGHDGSMTTVHANTPREAVSRLETLCLMAGMDLPVQAIRDQIAGAVNLFIQIGRLSDGSRKVKSITEVVGMQGDTITLQEIFRFKEEGFDKNRKIIGQFQPMGLIPTFIEKFEQRGVSIPRNLFSAQPKSTQPNNLDKSKETTATPIRTAAKKPVPARPKPRMIKKASGGNE